MTSTTLPFPLSSASLLTLYPTIQVKIVMIGETMKTKMKMTLRKAYLMRQMMKAIQKRIVRMIQRPRK